VWVIIGWLTKSAYLLSLKTTSVASQYASNYLDEIIILHGVVLPIIFDRETEFIVQFCKSFRFELKTHLNLSTT
jgi:hypothetical protein